MPSQIKFRAWTAPVGGVSTQIWVPSSAVPDSLGGGTWLHVKNDLGSSLQCVSWDGTNEGATPIYVAKPQELRCGTGAVLSNTILGVVYNYLYNAQADFNGMTLYTRVVSGGATETDYIIPTYVAGQEILAATIPSIVLDWHSCSLIDLNVAGRAWAAALS